MAIKIKTEKPVIPIEIGKLKFEFDISDESIKNFRDGAEEVQKDFESMKGDDLETAKKALKKGFEYILGEGSFEKIYEQTPSVVTVSQYFEAVVQGIDEELKKRTGNTQQQKAQKYLQNKKKK